MTDCLHLHLSKLADHSEIITSGKLIYRCVECRRMLKVTLELFQIKVSYPASGKAATCPSCGHRVHSGVSCLESDGWEEDE
jgi:DNA-directed RNA polymerase subunit RPC12/RpoP